MSDNQMTYNKKIRHELLHSIYLPHIDIHMLHYLIMLSEFYQRRGEFISFSQDTGRIRNFVYWRHPWCDRGSRSL